MKSLAELEAIRNKVASNVTMRKDDHAVRVVVGMATCGIAAGARPVMNAFVEEIQKRNLEHVSVVQTGCIGVCRLEPIVEILVPGEEKVTYVKMTPEKARTVVAEHLVNGRPVKEYTIGEADK
ncbi:MAG: (2Fe-2S) ferredoxin domain-containing protein [Clostridia bacterium]|nr:(2Fe-2S) ferredoxin domain-containing protein [Clostridia bacterium]